MTDQAAAQTAESDEPRDAKGTKRGKRRGRPEGEVPPALDLDEIRQVVELIDRHGFTEFEIDRAGYHLRLRRELTPQLVQSAPAPAARPVGESLGAAAPASETTPAPAAPAPAAPAVPVHIITSPIVGTFYRSPSPDAAPFVNLGDRVDHDTIVCIIEAMKLMNEIMAEGQGVIKEIFVENGQPVEFGQPLFSLG